MTLCEKCIHGDICADRDGMDADDEIALVSCHNFKNKADFVEVVRCRKCKFRFVKPLLDDFYCEKTDKKIKLHHFCSWGERVRFRE